MGWRAVIIYTAISQAFEHVTRNAGLPVIRFHDLRHTHATLLIKEGVPVKVVSERLGHVTTAFTIETYQYVLPGMQADAAKQFGQLIDPSTDDSREKTRKIDPGDAKKPWQIMRSTRAFVGGGGRI